MLFDLLLDWKCFLLLEGNGIPIDDWSTFNPPVFNLRKIRGKINKLKLENRLFNHLISYRLNCVHSLN